jgi:GDP-L-fucose synthase
MAEACVFLMQRLEELFSDPCSSVRDRPIINIGCGKDNTIREVAEMVARVAGFDGTVEWDSSKPDGTPKKLLDVSRMSDLGWKAGICMEEGLRNTYEDYLRKLAGSKPCAM